LNSSPGDWGARLRVMTEGKVWSGRPSRKRDKEFPSAAFAVLFLFCAVVGCGKRNAAFDETSREIEAAGRLHAETMAAQTANKVSLKEERSPASFDAKLATGDQLRAKGETARALWAYLQALELEPDSLEPRTRIGLLHLEDDPDRSAAVFSMVLEEDPDSVAAQFGLGLAFIAQGDAAAAQGALQRADELLPNTPTILAARGSLEEKLGNRKAGLILLHKAHDLDPTDRDILNNLGVALMLDDRLEESTKIFERATLLYPDDMVLQNNLGLTYGLREKYERALHAFSKDGDERSAHNNLGYVYFLNGRLDDALEEYEAALLADGTNSEIVLRNIDAVLAVQSQEAPASAAE
jgi:Flp pilus assembly protein TadD